MWLLGDSEKTNKANQSYIKHQCDMLMSAAAAAAAGIVKLCAFKIYSGSIRKAAFWESGVTSQSAAPRS